jgi:SurA-like protein
MLRSSVIFCALLCAALPAAAGETGVAARVNGVAIGAERAQRYFEDFLAERGRSVAAIRSPAAYEALRRESLARLVDAELLWQEAQRRGLLATKADVDAELAGIRTRFPAPGAFERRLERAGFTAESYADYLRKQLSIRRLVQERIAAGLSGSDARDALAREVEALRQRARIEIPGAR